MYHPTAFKMHDLPEIHAFMRAYSFAVLVTGGEGGLAASHLPLVLDGQAGPNGRLVGHMARANSQWKDLQGEAVAIFSGPHTYISPTWYESPGTVPTWNYVAVHAHGPLRLVHDRDGLRDILRRSVAAYERPRPEPWIYDESDPALDRMLGAIVGFQLDITRLEGKAKLSQNHPEERRRKVIRALEDRPDDDSRAIARLMAATLEPSDLPDQRSSE